METQPIIGLHTTSASLEGVAWHGLRESPQRTSSAGASGDLKNDGQARKLGSTGIVNKGIFRVLGFSVGVLVLISLLGSWRFCRKSSDNPFCPPTIPMSRSLLIIVYQTLCTHLEALINYLRPCLERELDCGMSFRNDLL
jgi:hypothetical protein